VNAWLLLLLMLLRLRRRRRHAVRYCCVQVSASVCIVLTHL
jgi:hypothetical protein